MSQWTHVAGVLRIDAIRLRGLPGQLADPLDPPTKLLGFMTPEIADGSTLSESRLSP